MRKLKVYLENKGIKNGWLADKVGVSPTLMSLWLSDERSPSDEQVRDMANALGVAVGEIN